MTCTYKHARSVTHFMSSDLSVAYIRVQTQTILKTGVIGNRFHHPFGREPFNALESGLFLAIHYEAHKMASINRLNWWLNC
jgi:hypothetical protein